MQYAFYFDQSRCSGCDTCTVACKDWNGIKAGPVKLRRKYDMEETGTFPDLKVSYLVYSCHHCNSPACVDVCPSGAIVKETSTGLVLVDRAKCSGLGECVKKCPYGNVNLMDDTQEPGVTLHQAYKCTVCYDRLEINKQPACVGACPNRAIDFGTTDYIRLKYPHAVRAVDVNGFPQDSTGTDGSALPRPTSPNLFIKQKF